MNNITLQEGIAFAELFQITLMKAEVIQLYLYEPEGDLNQYTNLLSFLSIVKYSVYKNCCRNEKYLPF